MDEIKSSADIKALIEQKKKDLAGAENPAQKMCCEMQLGMLEQMLGDAE